MSRFPALAACVLAALLATPSTAAATPFDRLHAGGDRAELRRRGRWRRRRGRPGDLVHPDRPADSIVIGTLKNGGLTVFDLRGRELQHIATPPGGRFNNVDVIGRYAVVSDRGLDRIRVYEIDGVLDDVTTANPPLAFSTDEQEVEEQRTVYGLTTWSTGGAQWVVASRWHETTLGLFRLVEAPDGVTYRRTALLDLPDTFRVGGGTWTPCAEPGGAAPGRGHGGGPRGRRPVRGPGGRRHLADPAVRQGLRQAGARRPGPGVRAARDLRRGDGRVRPDRPRTPEGGHPPERGRGGPDDRLRSPPHPAGLQPG